MTNTISSDQEKLKTELLNINMGPQHPATHGVLQVTIKTDSEIVVECNPNIGFLHRCMEKICEHTEYRGIVPFVDRLDYVAAMNNEWGFVLGAEKMMGVEVPERAEYIRVITGELCRIASHLVAFGTYAIDLGAFSPFLYTFDEREKILRFFEELSGARLLYNYVCIGGVRKDITTDQLNRIKSFCDHFVGECKKYDTLISQNKIFIERTANVGVLDKEQCFQYGLTGPMLRGAGVNWDLRKNRPYSIYDQLDFDVMVARAEKGVLGDCYNRYIVRMMEMEESVKIIRQCLDRIKEGPIMPEKMAKVIKLPKGEIYCRTECPRGELGFHIISDGKKMPYRVKVKSPCFSNVSALPEVGKGHMVADLVSIIGSIDIVLGEIDR